MLKGVLLGVVITYIYLQRNPQYLNTSILSQDISNKLKSLTQPPPPPLPVPVVVGPFGYIKKILPVLQSELGVY